MSEKPKDLPGKAELFLPGDFTGPEMEPENASWRRRVGETPKAWRAFQIYLELGVGRTVRKSIEAYSAQSVGRKPTYRANKRTWFGWSCKNKWIDRSSDYDDWVTSCRNVRRERMLSQAYDRVAEIGYTLLGKLQARVNEMDPTELEATSLAATLKKTSEVVLESLGHVRKSQSHLSLSGSGQGSSGKLVLMFDDGDADPNRPNPIPPDPLEVAGENEDEII